MRELVLMKGARAAFDALPTDAARRAVASVIAELMDDHVPLVRRDDIGVRFGASIMGRPVPGTELVVCYVPAGEQVFVVSVQLRPA